MKGGRVEILYLFLLRYFVTLYLRDDRVLVLCFTATVRYKL